MLIKKLILVISVTSLMILMASCGDDNPVETDTTAPTILSVSPADGHTGVSVTTVITVEFSECIAASSVRSSTFQLTDCAAADITCSDSIITLTPEQPLGYSKVYVASVLPGVTDRAGNGLKQEYLWSFTTQAAPDILPPTIESRIPAPGATNVEINSGIMVRMSEAIDPSTIDPHTITVDNGITGTTYYNGTYIILSADQDFDFSTTYEVTLHAGVCDLAGNAMTEDVSWTFSTEPDPVGLIWTERAWPDGLDLITLSQLAVTSGMYCAVDHSSMSTEIVYSTDGVDWSFASFPPGYEVATCFWLDTAFFAFDRSGLVWVSKDAANWTVKSFTEGPIQGQVVSTGTLYVGVEWFYPCSEVYTSTDGVNWTQVADYGNWAGEFFTDMLWTGSEIMATVSYPQTDWSVWSSTDGVTWTSLYTTGYWDFNELAYSGQSFLMSGSLRIMSSPDGINWTTTLGNLLDTYEELIWAGDRWAALVDRQYVVSSFDGATWDTLYTHDSDNLRAMKWIDDRFIVVGWNVILTSP